MNDKWQQAAAIVLAIFGWGGLIAGALMLAPQLPSVFDGLGSFLSCPIHMTTTDARGQVSESCFGIGPRQ